MQNCAPQNDRPTVRLILREIIELLVTRYQIIRLILSLHTDVSVLACTSLRPFVITSKEKGVVAELLDTVAKHRFVQKIYVLSE